MFILGVTKNVFKDFQCSETARRYSVKKMILKSPQNSNENICVVSLFIKLQTFGTGMFDEFCKIFKNGFIDRFPLEIGSECF